VGSALLPDMLELINCFIEHPGHNLGPLWRSICFISQIFFSLPLDEQVTVLGIKMWARLVVLCGCNFSVDQWAHVMG
jgi:hypothetical protein